MLICIIFSIRCNVWNKKTKQTICCDLLPPHSIQEGIWRRSLPLLWRPALGSVSGRSHRALEKDTCPVLGPGLGTAQVFQEAETIFTFPFREETFKCYFRKEENIWWSYCIILFLNFLTIADSNLYFNIFKAEELSFSTICFYFSFLFFYFLLSFLL